LKHSPCVPRTNITAPRTPFELRISFEFHTVKKTGNLLRILDGESKS